MARKMVILDDIDGSDGAEERQFGWDGVALKIDLGDVQWAKLQDLLAPYLEVAEPIGSYAVNRTAPKRRTPLIDTDRHTREEIDSLRLWAHGHRIRLPRGGGKVAEIVWSAWRQNDPSVVPQRYFLDEGEENVPAALPREIKQEQEPMQQEMLPTG